MANICKSKGNQTMKFCQLIEYNTRSFKTLLYGTFIVLFYRFCYVFRVHVSQKLSPENSYYHIIKSRNVNLWSSPSAIFVSFRNMWPLISWFHWNKSGRVSICRSFSCSSFTISFVKNQIVWKFAISKTDRQNWITFCATFSLIILV